MRDRFNLKLFYFPKVLIIIFLSAVLTSCGGGGSSDNKIAPLYDVYPYSSSPDANLNCALQLSDNPESSCRLEKLPLIGTQTTNPSKQDIKNRLLVSHDWMGSRFMQLLDEMPDDIRLMLRSVTAIVIADNIRPSFYTTQTAAIYLDPKNLWLTDSEENTTSDAGDFRSGFSNALNFTSLSRYLRPDGSAAYIPESRTLDDLTFPLARLLYHELAHANTFLPPSTHKKINPQHRVFEAVEDFLSQNAGVQIKNSLPLQSETMKELAYVMYRGETATDDLKSLSATQVGDAMASDRASDDYAYVPFRDDIFYEDVAMLFEELMAKYHFDHDREIAYANASNSIYCEPYILQWGQTGRIGDSNVKEAARITVKALIPELDLDTFIDNLDAPLQTSVGINWCEALNKKLGKGISLNINKIDISRDLLPPHYR
jgi:hypothetical protein